MKKLSKAVLLSALVFPGTGHMVYKQYLRGSILILSALIASSVIVKSIFERALIIVDQINKGEILAETSDIAVMVSNSTSGTDSHIEKTAVIILGVCWLIGIIDCYRLDVAQKKIANTG